MTIEIKMVSYTLTHDLALSARRDVVDNQYLVGRGRVADYARSNIAGVV